MGQGCKASGGDRGPSCHSLHCSARSPAPAERGQRDMTDPGSRSPGPLFPSTDHAGSSSPAAARKAGLRLSRPPKTPKMHVLAHTPRSQTLTPMRTLSRTPTHTHAHPGSLRQAADPSAGCPPGSLRPPSGDNGPIWEAHLYVLQGQALPAASSVSCKRRAFTRHQAEDAQDGLHGWVDVETDVVAGERKGRCADGKTKTQNTEFTIFISPFSSIEDTDDATSSSRTFHQPRRKPCAHERSLPTSSSSSPRGRLTHCLSLWTCAFWTFQRNGITQDLCFRDCLLSLRMVLSRLIHIVARVSASLLSKAEYHPLFVTYSAVDGHLSCSACCEHAVTDPNV